ncbi:MAG: hypothetical protein NVS3B3_15970 [Aquirhabdus sp.]
MAITYTKLFQPLQLGSVAAKIVAVPVAPASSILLNGRLRAVNNTGVATTVTIYAMPVGGSAAITNILVNAKSISANDWLDTDLPEMAAGDEIWAFTGTVNSVTLHYMDGVIRS